MSKHGQRIRRAAGAGGPRRLRIVSEEPSPQPLDEELWLRADPGELARAREFVASAAELCGFDEAGRYQLMLAASEALTNAIEHGSPFADGKYRLRAVVEGEALSLYVTDCGTSTWDLTDPGFLSERGRGLSLVGLLMDEIELQPTGDRTTVRLSKRLRG